MSAPDLPPPIAHAPVSRPLAAHLTAAQADPADLAGTVVVMIDALRASTTIAAALHAGAPSITPILTVEQAQSAAASQSPRPALCGERAGRHIPGFDLGNSPRDFTPGAIGGRHILFTTTNGTAALLHAAAAGAAEILVGSFANLSAICDRLAEDARPVHLLCAGTRDRVSLDDCIAAGAMIDRLLTAGRNLTADDPARLCLAAWHLAECDLPAAMLASRGGRNLAAIGLTQDVLDCCEIDAHPVLPRFDPATGAIRSI
ncbi:MAG: 2-phosphosulfolactate phosphatase [Phycisphaerales bacterium]|nr:2-phosphosulfolactate phosphatase [Phycisphaerales bacterium]